MEEILSTISEVLFNNYIDKTFKSIGVIDVKNLKDIINYLEINVIKKNLEKFQRDYNPDQSNHNDLFDLIVIDFKKIDEKGILTIINESSV